MVRRSLLLAVLSIAVPAAAAAQDVLMEQVDMDQDGYYDSYGYDSNGDGIMDKLLVDGDEDTSAEIMGLFYPDGRTYQMWVDTTGSRFYDLMLQPTYAGFGGAQVGWGIYLDADENGMWESAYHDAQGDGVYEWVLVDSDLDGAGDQWTASAAPPGSTAADEAARHVSHMAAMQLMAAAGLNPFSLPTYVP